MLELNVQGERRPGRQQRQRHVAGRVWGIDGPRVAATWRGGEGRWELRPELVRPSHRHPYLTH